VFTREEILALYLLETSWRGDEEEHWWASRYEARRDGVISCPLRPEELDFDTIENLIRYGEEKTKVSINRFHEISPKRAEGLIKQAVYRWKHLFPAEVVSNYYERQ